MNAILFADVPTDSQEGWQAFTLAHGMDHDTVYATMLKLDKVPEFYPMYEFPRENNDDYLMMHQTVHQSNASLLGIVDLPDLATIDFSDADQLADWLVAHQSVHLAENTALGLT